MTQREDTSGSLDARGYRRWLFADRALAGKLLASKLSRQRTAEPLVLATDCAGIPVALALAAELGSELDIKASCALVAPVSPEYALGAVTADGTSWLDRQAVVELGLSNDWVEHQLRTKSVEAQRVERELRRDQPPLAVAGRAVILTDEGIATGATMRAAATSLRGHAAQIVIAVPLASASALALVADVADDVICLQSPTPFISVNAHYRSTEPFTSAQAERALSAFRRERRSTPAVTPRPR